MFIAAVARRSMDAWIIFLLFLFSFSHFILRYEGLSDEPASGLLRPSHAVERDFAFYYEPFYAAATKGNPGG